MILKKVLFPGKNSLFVWFPLSSLLRELIPDVIYCWGEPWCLSTWQVCGIAKKLGIPFYFYSAENREKHLPFPFGWIRSRVFQNSCGAICITNAVRHCLIQSGFKKLIHIIPLWVSRFGNMRNRNTYKIAYVGRLIPLKQVDTLIRAVALLPEFSIEIVGDGPERQGLRLLATNLGISQRVLFHGFIDSENLDTILANVGLVVIPTRETSRQAEQFGKAALEALALGIPVLTSHTGNYIDLSREFSCLYTTHVSDELTLSKKIVEIINHYPNHELLLAEKNQVWEKYSYQAVSGLFDNLFFSFEKETGKRKS